MTEVLFGSDNQAGISEEVMRAIIDSDTGTAVAYGDDIYTSKVNARYSEVFETKTFVFPVATGTAANALGLSAITPGYGETLCHEAAHIITTEGGAPEFYAGGSRLVGLPGANGKLAADHLSDVLSERTRPSRHHYACSSLSITQATEFGTVYALDQLEALASVARERGLRVHMDGARFTNALVALGGSPATLSWKAGVDVLSLGTTKNGTMNAEAVIVFDELIAKDIAYRYKRAGLMTSKMRYVSVQLLAFVENDLWLRNARHANEIARLVAEVLRKQRGVKLLHPVETNQIFAVVPEAVSSRLAKAGIRFRSWDHDNPGTFRLVTSFRDDEGTVKRIKQALRAS